MAQHQDREEEWVWLNSRIDRGRVTQHQDSQGVGVTQHQDSEGEGAVQHRDSQGMGAAQHRDRKGQGGPASG